MPRYELMYILASSVSDDLQPQVAEQIVSYVSDLNGTDIQETQLGKKKLAYPIKKTRNGFYGVVDFTMDTKSVNALDAKIRTQDSTIIRYILVNLDEHLERLAKDRDVQTKIIRNRPVEQIPTTGEESVEIKPLKTNTVAPVTDSDLDQEIEKALTEDLTI